MGGCDRFFSGRFLDQTFPESTLRLFGIGKTFPFWKNPAPITHPCTMRALRGHLRKMNCCAEERQKRRVLRMHSWVGQLCGFGLGWVTMWVWFRKNESATSDSPVQPIGSSRFSSVAFGFINPTKSDCRKHPTVNGGKGAPISGCLSIQRPLGLHIY